MRRDLAGMRAQRAMGYLAAFAIAAVMLIPFLWMVSTSLMGEFEVLQYPPPLVPASPQWRNFPEALTTLPFARFFLNSSIVALFTVTGQVITGACGGYALARFRFAGERAVFAAYLGALMIPGIVLLIPRFLLVDALGGVDTMAGLVSTELVSLWGVFMMRQFFVTMPRETEDAARIDGASEWTIFWRIAVPLARPALATFGLFAFIDAWKAFLWPLVITRSMGLRTVEVGIASFHGLYYANWPYQMAAAVTALLPVMAVFLLTQRYVTRGIQLTGLR
ncbi:MAG: carbohydrate ABC transporter permease [Gemmatimonadaceae bacterium]|nr:carbohydrate ABC transporter permease [Gemmatimonadaceae bacterium]